MTSAVDRTFQGDERELVRWLKDCLEKEKPAGLKRVFILQNLATRKYRELWEEWWESEAPPRVEIDMILVFEDGGELLLPGVEVKYFKSGERKFCEGLQQALSFGLFGFDSLILWHIFSEEMENKEVEGFVGPTKELIEGLNLPVVYFATKLIGEDMFEFFAPRKLYSSQAQNTRYFLTWLRNYCRDERNPLLGEGEVEKRRKLLKVILKIPV